MNNQIANSEQLNSPQALQNQNICEESLSENIEQRSSSVADEDSIDGEIYRKKQNIVVYVLVLLASFIAGIQVLFANHNNVEPMI